MSLLFKPAAAISLVFGSLAILDFVKIETIEKNKVEQVAPKPPAPRIQVAVLLDVSNSMDGLINQAKAQLWNMVSVLGKAECNQGTPQLEIALYEYGRPDNGASRGYIRQINGFITDLDQLSKNLFNLTTNGGLEYCGKVMYNALTEINWDTSSSSYKTIFIAGNEDFLQGDVSFSKACDEARKRNVVVNTIYCGDRMQGIREHWNVGSECGQGSYTNINQNSRVDEIPTPYDSTLFVLNDRLNATYIGYGSRAMAGAAQQAEVDKLNMAYSQGVAARRVAVKGKKEIYSNGDWDLVDARKADSTIISKVDMKTLPAELKHLSREQLKQHVDKKSREREQIQQEIAAVSNRRDAFIAEQKKKQATASNTPTLETEIEKIIRQQAGRFKMTFK